MPIFEKHNAKGWIKLAAFILAALLTACTPVRMNDTAYQYHYNTSIDLVASGAKVLVAPYNLGVPSKKYLRPYEAQIDSALIKALKAEGYQVDETSLFEDAWRQAVRKNGNIYTSGEASINQSAFKRVIAEVFAKIREQSDIDLIVFTDLVEQLVIFSGNNSRVAKWHGVSRKPQLQGGNQLAASFDWQQTVPAISLRVVIYTREGQLLFKSFGGLEVSRRLDTSRGRFVRKEKLFSSPANVSQGVRVALHPFVPFE